MTRGWDLKKKKKEQKKKTPRIECLTQMSGEISEGVDQTHISLFTFTNNVEGRGAGGFGDEK